MGQAAYSTTIKKSGTSTTFTAEACSVVTGNTYQIDASAKEIFDRTATFTFYEGGSPIASSDITSVDYLFGKVTFATSKSGAITVTGKYMPIAVAAGANTYSIDVSSDILDDTDFASAQASSGYRSKVQGILDSSINIDRWDDLTKDFSDILEARTPVLIEIAFGGSSTDIFRGWYVLETDSHSGDIGSLESESLSFQADLLETDKNDNTAFGWKN